jgi:hypothetical protein
MLTWMRKDKRVKESTHPLRGLSAFWLNGPNSRLCLNGSFFILQMFRIELVAIAIYLGYIQGGSFEKRGRFLSCNIFMP